MKSSKTIKKNDDGSTMSVRQSLGLKRNISKANLTTFDAYFRILQKKNPKILNHHKIPMARFLSQFGNINAQESAWFETHLKTYG